MRWDFLMAIETNSLRKSETDIYLLIQINIGLPEIIIGWLPHRASETGSRFGF